MKHPELGSPAGLALGLLGAATLAHAQADLDDLSLSKNRVRISARFGFDVSGEIKNLPPAGGTVGSYDDGYVHPDISGGAGGKTWNWGYANASQVNVNPTGTTIAFNRVEGSPRDGTTDSLSQTPTPGFEILYGRELARLRLSERHSAVIGAEVGFGTMDYNLSGGSSMNGSVTQTTDIYNFNGITPPLAPYSGTYNGPGPLLNQSPTSSSSTQLAASSAISERVRSLVYGFKLGPYAEVPLYKRLSLELGAGVAAVIADTELSYTETVRDPAGVNPVLLRSRTLNHSDNLFGFYGTGSLAYEVGNDIRIFVGGQYQHLGNATVSDGSKEATLKLGGTIEAVVGVSIGF
jgi:hypothetical protein